jgi:cell division protease FtsH
VKRLDASEATEREIDIAVWDIVVKAFERAPKFYERRADLDEGARLLLQHETVTADRFPAVRSAGPQTKSAA